MAGKAESIKQAGSSIAANAKLCNLFNDLVDIDAYYTYKGSLTTPECYESVTWIVFKDPITAKPIQVIGSNLLIESYPANA